MKFLLVLVLFVASCTSGPEDCRQQCAATAKQLRRPLRAKWEVVHPLPGELAEWTVCRCAESR